ncbi:MAG: hypothetical protein ACXVHQ_39000 [Solirubrobacteraceae bacterium]
MQIRAPYGKAGTAPGPLLRPVACRDLPDGLPVKALAAREVSNSLAVSISGCHTQVARVRSLLLASPLERDRNARLFPCERHVRARRGGHVLQHPPRWRSRHRHSADPPARVHLRDAFDNVVHVGAVLLQEETAAAVEDEDGCAERVEGDRPIAIDHAAPERAVPDQLRVSRALDAALVRDHSPTHQVRHDRRVPDRERCDPRPGLILPEGYGAVRTAQEGREFPELIHILRLEADGDAI